MFLSAFHLSLAILAGLICLVNLTFVLLVYHRNTVKNLQKALLLSLGCSDFFAGFLAIPFILICGSVTKRSDRCVLCVTSYLLHRFISMSSALHLLSIVYERYLKIIHPFFFEQNEFTRLRGTRIVLALWLTSLLISAVPLTWLLSEIPCPGDLSERLTMYYDYLCLAFFVLLVLLMIFAFVRIYFVVRAHLRDIRKTAVQTNGACQIANNGAGTDQDRRDIEVACEISGMLITKLAVASPSWTRRSDLNCIPGMDSLSETECEDSPNPYRKSQRRWLIKEARIITRFAMMVLLFVFAWGPYFYISTVIQKGDEVSLLVKHICGAARFLNPLMNPWIVTINNQDFRGVWAVFPACFRRLMVLFSRQGPERRNKSIESREIFEGQLVHISSV